jgi:hypothetical protein
MPLVFRRHLKRRRTLAVTRLLIALTAAHR